MSKEKKEIKYVVAAKSFSIIVQIKDEKGKKVKDVDSETGVQKRVNRTPQFHEDLVDMKNVIDSVKKGYLCEYNVTEETPNYIADAFKKCAENRSHPVITYDTWIKENNPERHAEMVRADQAEKAAAEAYEKGKAEGQTGDIKKLTSEKNTAEIAVENLTNEVAEKDETIADLQKKVAEIEKNAGK